MRIFNTIILGTITLISQGQQSNYNDWFEFNLKGKPKKIKDISIYSLSDTTFLNLPCELKSCSVIDEFQFDSLGFIVRKRDKQYNFSLFTKWIDYSVSKAINYKDSIIAIYNLSGENIEIKRFYDQDGFLIKEIFDKTDTSLFSRDLSHRIKTSYVHFYGTDFNIITIKNLEYNINGDIQQEKRSEKYSTINCEECQSSTKEYVYEYKYIYDPFKNWILKICFVNDKISMITQREIIY